jgi:P27 family predicted phage terminase small subunit
MIMQKGAYFRQEVDMGKRGPAPKPTALRVLQGDHPGRINRSEPKPLDTPLVKPDWLTPDASELWDRLVPHFAAMGTVKSCDTELLAAYCEAWARFRRLQGMVNMTAPLIKGRDGLMVKNPVWSQMIKDCTTDLRVLAREFGLTPSARAGLKAEPPRGDVGRLFTTG